MYQIPKSYRAYCTDPAVRTAVDHIVDKPNKLGVPPDIEWNELPAFHKAVLSAHQVQCEYAIHLFDLWKCIWQPALDNCGFEVTPRTIAGTEEYQGNSKLDTYTIWKHRWFFRAFYHNIDDSKKFALTLGTCTEDTKQTRISLYFWNGQDDTDHHGLDDDWITDEDDWPPHVISRRGLAPIGDDGTVDLDSLRKAAADALATVKASLPA